AATLDVAGLERDVEQRTDVYFKRTRAVVRSHGDKQVTYAVFMRRPVIFAARLMIDWLQTMAAARGTEFTIEPCFEEGDWVGAGEALVYIT
ncbi:hypothetical protein ABTK74_19785, partial [Acinetobacter baumannii]